MLARHEESMETSAPEESVMLLWQMAQVPEVENKVPRSMGKANPGWLVSVPEAVTCGDARVAVGGGVDVGRPLVGTAVGVGSACPPQATISSGIRSSIRANLFTVFLPEMQLPLLVINIGIPHSCR